MLCQQRLQPLQPLCSRLIATEADEDLSEFLKDEIEYEKESIPDLPKFQDFDVKRSGTKVVLTRRFNKETVTIKFDINENNNVDETAEEEMQDEESAGGHIVSYPHFTVSITKPSGKSIEFDCIYEFEQPEEGETDDMEEQQQGFDIFKFENVSVLEDGQSREDGVYESETTNMDGNLYVFLLNMMAERGVTSEFVQDLLKFSTAIEHRQHVKFLEDLKTFVDGR